MKLLAARLLSVRRSAPRAAAATALLRVTALTLTLALTLIRIASTGLPGLGRTFTISRSEHDLEFDQFIPLCIRALPIGDRQQGLHSLAR